MLENKVVYAAQAYRQSQCQLSNNHTRLSQPCFASLDAFTMLDAYNAHTGITSSKVDKIIKNGTETL